MFLDYSVGNGIAGMIKIEDRQFVRLPGYDRIIREQTWKVMTSLISALESNKKEKGNVDDRLRQLFLSLFYSYVHPFRGELSFVNRITLQRPSNSIVSVARMIFATGLQRSFHPFLDDCQ